MIFNVILIEVRDCLLIAGIMKKKAPPKKQQIINNQDGFDDEQIDEDEQTPTRRGRHDNSLAVLTKKFIQLIKNSENCTIDLNEAVTKLGVQKRRIYDITNVLQGINYVQKLHKNTIKWVGGNEDPQVQREITEMKRKLREMQEEEIILDQQLADYNRQIKEDFLEKSQYKPYHYITFDDCQKICKSLSQKDTSKTLLIISAPKGAKLEVGEEQQKGDCVLKLDATGKEDPIKFYTCTQSEGVKEIKPSKAQ